MAEWVELTKPGGHVRDLDRATTDKATAFARRRWADVRSMCYRATFAFDEDGLLIPASLAEHTSPVCFTITIGEHVETKP